MIVGIDPSLSGTAVMYGGLGDPDPESRVFCLKSKGRQSVRSRVDRFCCLAEVVADAVRSIGPKAVFIEGYSFASRTAGQASIHEYGGLLRWHLSRAVTCDIVELPPSTVKKFFSGKGNATKEQMADAAIDRYGFRSDDDNIVDAYAVWRLGCVISGAEPKDSIEIEGLYLATTPKRDRKKARKGK